MHRFGRFVSLPTHRLPDSGSIRRAACASRTWRRSTRGGEDRSLLNRAVVNRRKLTARTSYLHTIEIRGPYTAGVSPLQLSLHGVEGDVHLQNGLSDAYAAVCFHRYARIRAASLGNVFGGKHELIARNLRIRYPRGWRCRIIATTGGIVVSIRHRGSWNLSPLIARFVHLGMDFFS